MERGRSVDGCVGEMGEQAWCVDGKVNEVRERGRSVHGRG